MTAVHPYINAAIALATMHAKAEALAPAFATLTATLVVPADIDTDALGTFTGEVPRLQPPLETAIAKARLAMTATGLPLGLATEGSFGPDPVLGMVPLHREVAVLVDDLHGHVVCEWRNSHETNFANRVIGGASELDDAQLARWGFPSHALIVRSESDDPSSPSARIHKALRDRAALQAAIADCVAASPLRRARVETDMRAHLNPTRMRQIALLGEHLVQRLQNRCPKCRAPGFGRIDVVAGLPCRWCGTPTAAILAEIHGCAACGERIHVPRADGLREVDPAQCDHCNP
jgi:hypothetical protein